MQHCRLTLVNMKLDEGLWRSSGDSIEILPCPPGNGCVSANSTGVCATGYMGPLCSACSAGYAKSAALTCVPCEGGTVLGPLLALLAATVALGVIFRLVGKLFESNGKAEVGQSKARSVDKAQDLDGVCAVHGAAADNSQCPLPA